MKSCWYQEKTPQQLKLELELMEKEYQEQVFQLFIHVRTALENIAWIWEATAWVKRTGSL